MAKRKREKHKNENAPEEDAAQKAWQEFVSAVEKRDTAQREQALKRNDQTRKNLEIACGEFNNFLNEAAFS